ncbi:MAG: hypothetical protein Q9219_001562 [cf. Caloplaca sp. 3 TL-2023]
MPPLVKSRILFIDAYDSFSNNIVSLLESKLQAVKVTAVKIDDEISDFPIFLRQFDAAVAGPGPGHPANPTDIGLVAKLWEQDGDDVCPVLGICLGFQSLITALGGTVRQLPEPRHGVVRTVTHCDDSIFKDVGNITSVQYHSFYACLDSNEHTIDTTPDLEPLAWDTKVDNHDRVPIEEPDSNPHRILMAIKHRQKPFYALQFHPESICSNQACHRIVENWWSQAQQWNHQRRSRCPLPGLRETLSMKIKTQNHELDLEEIPARVSRPGYSAATHDLIRRLVDDVDMQRSTANGRQVVSRRLGLDGLSVPHVCKLLRLKGGEVAVLDSEPHQRVEVGTHSIIGALDSETVHIEYTLGGNSLHVRHNERIYPVDLAHSRMTVFDYLKSLVNDCRGTGGDPKIPFWGGLIGYISYEACLGTIDVSASGHAGKPDICFAFVERSVVIDHQRGEIHVQSVRGTDDYQWVQMVASELANARFTLMETPVPELGATISYPEPCFYKAKIRKCQEYIHSGDSYELCLTNQVAVNTNHLADPWPLYLRLRSLNAAPFSAYMHLGGMTLLSSSPERFMCWSRPFSTADGSVEETKSIVQFRPIKGTVKRYPNGPNKPAIDLEEATTLLSTPKEQAENLMIVDLIRHDLHGVVGSGNVCVPKLMVVEEYATLFQLVTVVEGTLINQGARLTNPPSLTVSSQTSPSSSRPSTPPSDRAFTSLNGLLSYDGSTKPSPTAKTGIDVLAASLPPGSMTGAPKRRSCALLREMEGEQPRSIYSGVVGYMDVGGGGDFSVVIRSAFRWDTDEQPKDRIKKDTWNVGAGGAITSLSTEEGEWEEMMAKLSSTLRIFQ